MKNNGIFAVLQKIGRAFMLPIAVLPMAGILLGVGGSFTNPVLIKTYNLTFLEPGTPLNYLMQLFSNVGLFVFANLPLLFAVGVAIGLANKNKETAALSAVLGFLLFHTIIGTILSFKGITPDSVTYDALIGKGLSEAAARGTAALYAKELGIFTLQTGVFGGIVCGIVASAITNKFSDKKLPDYLAFFSGNRFVPVMTIILFIPLAAIFPFIWPTIFMGIVKAGEMFAATGAIGFMGLMVPHIARMLCGNKHARLVPMAAVIGAIFLLCCDLFAKNAFYPKDLPIGILTSLIGGPFFLWMLMDKNYSFKTGK